MKRIRIQFGGVLWLLATGGLASGAFAQASAQNSSQTLADLHARLSAENAVISVEEAMDCSERLKQLGLNAEELPPAERAVLGGVEVYIAAALGDAAAALTRARQLLQDFPEDGAARTAAYVAACAAGDAQLASELGTSLAQGAEGEQRRVWAARRRQMREIGKQAPECEIRAGDGSGFHTRRRSNRVLLLDFWTMLRKPDETTSQALRSIYKESRGSRYFEMVGVNADAESRVAEARAFAGQAGYEWPQVYELASTNAPLTHGAFRAGEPPWQVLIDAYGYVRAVGVATEPGFRYAVRAALAECEGRYAAVPPRTREGEQAQFQRIEIEPSPAKKDAGDQELPSNPEAASKLRQARTFLRTGLRTKARELFEEILRDYPESREARDAQEYLDSMGDP